MHFINPDFQNSSYINYVNLSSSLILSAVRIFYLSSMHGLHACGRKVVGEKELKKPLKIYDFTGYFYMTVNEMFKRMVL